jgi:hypothetical protein
MSIASLIERLEKTTGPDRELDARIHAAINWARRADVTFKFYPGLRSYQVFCGEATGADEAPCDYTASIDAAVTLVPNGFAWKIGTCCVSDDAWVVPDYNSPIHGDRLRKELGEPVYGSIWDNGIDVDQRPPGRVAIALCIAALKAREAQS